MGWNVTGYDFCLRCLFIKQEGLLILNGVAPDCPLTFCSSNCGGQFVAGFGQSFDVPFPDCCKLMVRILPSNLVPLKASLAAFPLVASLLMGVKNWGSLNSVRPNGVDAVAVELLLLFARFGWRFILGSFENFGNC